MYRFFPEYNYRALPNRTYARRRGSVLIAVLGVLLMLSILVTLFIEETIKTLEYESLDSLNPAVERDAYAALEMSLAALAEIAQFDDGQLYAPEQGWIRQLESSEAFQQLGSGIKVKMIDASGRMPINTMSETQLNTMLVTVFDLDFGTIRTLSSSLLDWIDRDEDRRLNGAESADYLRSSVPYRAADQPLRTLQELRWVEGWAEVFFNSEGIPTEDFQKLCQLVTIRPVQTVNLNAAPIEVLDLLAWKSSWDPSFLFDGLGEDYLMESPASENGQGFGVTSGLLQIIVSVDRGGVPRTLSAWVIPNLETAPPNSGQSPAETVRKTGSDEQQQALGYPFQILEISWNDTERPPEPARYESLGLNSEVFSSSIRDSL